MMNNMTKQAKSKKKKNWLIWVLLAAIVLLVIAVYFKNKNEPKGLEVEVEKVSTRDLIEKVGASGKVFPEAEVKISSDVSGEIVELYVEEGDSVTVGQLLAKVDPDAYQSAVERTRASVNNSKAQLARSKAATESSIANVEQIESQLNNAMQIHKRNQQLLKEGILSDADYESSLSNVQSLEANLKAAKANLRSSEQSEIAAKYSVKSAEASLKEVQTSLRKTTIVAPTEGIISKLNVEKGERVVGTIQMAGTEMMRIANLNSMEVQVDVSENDILRVSLRDSVDIEVDAYLDTKFTGYVTEIANSASNTGTTVSLTSDQVTNFIVKIRIDPDSYKHLVKPNKPFPFRPGMSASVDIITDLQSDVLCVPIQAVTTYEEEDEDKQGYEEIIEVVYIYTAADTASRSPVKTGIQDDEYIQILSGVQEEEEVISGPYSIVARKLNDGDKVHRKEKGFKKKSDEGETE